MFCFQGSRNTVIVSWRTCEKPNFISPEISFAQDKHYPILFFYYEISKALTKAQLEKFFNIRFLKYSESYKEDGTSVLRETKMKVVACADLIGENRLDSIQVEEMGSTMDVVASTGVCVDPGTEDMTLGDSSHDRDPYQIVLLQILPCSLASGCASAEEVRKITFAVANPMPSVNFGVHEKPVSYITDADDYQFISMTLTSRRKFNLIKSQILDNKGFLAGEHLVASYSDVHSVHTSIADRDEHQTQCTEAQADDLSCAPYFVQEIMAVKKVIKYTREYKGLVESISEMGGMIKIVMMFFYWFYSYYNATVVREKLVDLIFEVKKPKLSLRKPLRCCKRKQKEAAFSSGPLSGRSDAELYQELESDIMGSLDIASIAKEVEVFRIVSHLLLPTSIRTHLPQLSKLVSKAQQKAQVSVKNESQRNHENLNPENKNAVANIILQQDAFLGKKIDPSPLTGSIHGSSDPRPVTQTDLISEIRDRLEVMAYELLGTRQTEQSALKPHKKILELAKVQIRKPEDFKVSVPQVIHHSSIRSKSKRTMKMPNF